MGKLYLTLAKKDAAVNLLERLKNICPSGCDELIALQKSFNESLAE